MRRRNTHSDSNGVSRRSYLAGGVASLSLPLAGCLGSLGGNGDGGNGGNGETDGSAGEDPDRLLVQDGTVVSVDPEIGVLEHGDVYVENGLIVEVGEGLTADDATVIDAEGSVVAPGFVNSHLHTWQAGVRGVAGDWTFMDYLDTMLGEVSSHYEPEDAYLGNLFGAAEQLNAGTTTILDWFHIANSPDHSDRAIDGLADAGIRAVFAHGPPGDDGDTWWEASTESHPDDIERLHEERFPAADDRLTLAMGIRGPDYASDEVVEEDITRAREMGIPVSMHAGSLGPGTVYSLEELGLLGDDLNYVHANRFEEEEFALIGDSGGSVSITPEVELQMGMGMPALGETIEAGATPSVGVDIVSNVSGDMFTQTRTAVQVQRGRDNQPAVEAGEQIGEVSVDAQRALELATIDGARALGLDDRIGSITPGKRADLTIIDGDHVNTAPVHNPVETVVFQAGVANVDTVVVDGTVVKRDGALLNDTLASEHDRFVESGERVLRESGLLG
ncbi:amidohydrolase family protein [Halorubrum gandharaense]